MVWHASHVARSTNAMMIGKIKYRILIELRDHFRSSIPTGCVNLLSERVCIAATRWKWDRGQELDAFNRRAFSFKEPSFFHSGRSSLHQWHQLLPIIEQHIHAPGQFGMKFIQVVHEIIN